MDGGVLSDLTYDERDYGHGYWAKKWYYQNILIYSEEYNDHYGICVYDYTLNRVYVHHIHPSVHPLDNEEMVEYPHPYYFTRNYGDDGDDGESDEEA